MSEPSTDRPRFLEPAARAAFETAAVAVLPVPYEATVSWGGGTARGPEAILRASEQLELRDERSGAQPHRVGVWTDAPLDVAAQSGEVVVEAIARRCGELMDAGKWVVMLGGEHSVTPGGVRAAAARHDGLQVVQLDAHADLRPSYEGSPWSHASAMARCLELAPVHAFGIRSYSAAEADRIRGGLPGYHVLHAWELHDGSRLDEALGRLAGRPVYLTVDVDYFDPSIVPATGTPEPGGPGWWPTLDLLERLCRESRVVACDVVELAPAPGLHHADYTAARLVYKLIGFVHRG